MIDKEKSALGLPAGSIRAILAIAVIGSTALAFLFLVCMAAWTKDITAFKEVMGGGAVWFGVVIMIARDYFSTGQNTDMIKETEKLLRSQNK